MTTEPKMTEERAREKIAKLEARLKAAKRGIDKINVEYERAWDYAKLHPHNAGLGFSVIKAAIRDAYDALKYEKKVGEDK